MILPEQFEYYMLVMLSRNISNNYKHECASLLNNIFSKHRNMHIIHAYICDKKFLIL